MSVLFLLLAALPPQTNITARQGISADGGVAWSVECTNCSGSSSSGTLSVNVLDAGIVQPVTDTQLRAAPVPVFIDGGIVAITAAALPLPSGAATDATLGQLLDGGVVVRGVVTVANPPAAPKRSPLTGAAIVDGSGVTQPVSAAALPLPAGAAQDATQQAILSAIAAQSQQRWSPMPVIAGPAPLNPFLPRCNPVRRTGCQP
jgi:hypothetical protein